MPPTDYFDIEKAVKELKAAGWSPWHAKPRSLGVSTMSTVWQSPNGNLYRGPAGAYKIMKQYGSKA